MLAISIQTTSPGPPNVEIPQERTGISFSTQFLHTVSGKLKCVCYICVLFGYICVQISRYTSFGADFFCLIAMICIWVTGTLIFLYVFQVVNVYTKIPWSKVEFYYCTGAAPLLMIASSLVATDGIGLFIAGGSFGFVAMCGYACDAFLKYQDLRAA